MSEVVQLPTLRVVPTEPNGDVVEKLEEMLTRAKAGDLIGLGYVAMFRGGDFSTGWQIAGRERNTLATGVALLQHRILGHIERESQ